MAKLVLFWCLWLAIVDKTVPSSPPGFDHATDRFIDHFSDEYLYEALASPPQNHKADLASGMIGDMEGMKTAEKKEP